MSTMLRDTLRSGAVAGLTTTVAAMALGQGEQRRPFAPINAVSHILFGDRAAHRSRASLKHTGSGLLLNLAAVTSWAMLHRLLFGRAIREGRVAPAIAGGIFTSLLAYFVDYYVVPKRLTPGFEKRLSNRSLFGIYAVLALALGLGSLLRKR